MPTKSLFKLAEEAEKQQALPEGQLAAVGQQNVLQLIHPPRESRVRLKWDDRLEQLKTFRAKHGHVDVPRSYAKDPSLGTFVCNQRQTYKRMNEGKGPSMDRSRVQQLNELGFKWVLKHKDQPVIAESDDEGSDSGGAVVAHSRAAKPKPLSWESGIEQLKEFQLVNGHSDVPHIYAANQPLGNFVKSIRQQYKNMQKGKATKLINEPRILELQRMGFKLQVRQREPWEQRFQELRQYVMQHGNCEAPKHTPLGIWILNQRSQFKLMLKKKPSHMSEERINLLNSLGFDWRVPGHVPRPIAACQVYAHSGNGVAYGASAANDLLPSNAAYAPPAANAAASIPSDAAFASALASEYEGSMPEIPSVPIKTEESDDESSTIQDTASDAQSFEQPDYQVAADPAVDNLATADDLENFVSQSLKHSPSARRVSEDSTAYDEAAASNEVKPSAVVPEMGMSHSYANPSFLMPGFMLPGMGSFDFRGFGDGSLMQNFSFQSFVQAPAPAGPAPPADLPSFGGDAFVQSLLNEDFSSSSTEEEVFGTSESDPEEEVLVQI